MRASVNALMSSALGRQCGRASVPTCGRCGCGAGCWANVTEAPITASAVVPARTAFHMGASNSDTVRPSRSARASQDKLKFGQVRTTQSGPRKKGTPNTRQPSKRADYESIIHLILPAIWSTDEED